MSREDSFYELLLNIRGHRELSECLKEFFQVWLYFFLCLQCFDAVGWAAGRASGL